MDDLRTEPRDAGLYARCDAALLRDFWTMLYNREMLAQRRRAGRRPPWTEDAILAEHRFTNVYRAADRVSQYLIQRVLYEGDQSPDEVVFRSLLFRIFNQIETWEILCATLGEAPSRATWSAARYGDILTSAAAAGAKLWNNAYMITPPPSTYGAAKHVGWLNILDAMLTDDVPDYVARATSLAQIYRKLLEYQTVGTFFAMQWTIDLNYSAVVNHSENSFIVAGGGAVRGGRKLAPHAPSTETLIAVLVARQELAFRELGLEFPWLGGSRRLHLIDVQSGLCEFDKWCRVAHPELGSGKLYARIKQKYELAGYAERPLPPLWFPPKWGLN